jgi:nucleotide-binding universal stress UspA family protein
MAIGFTKIMVGIDGSEESINAADYAIAIANRYNAELIAINVLTSDIGYAYSSPGVESPPLTIKEANFWQKMKQKYGLIKSKKKQTRAAFDSDQRLLWQRDLQQI